MATKTVTVLPHFAYGTAAAWANTDIVIPAGVPCWTSDTRVLKVGDGTNLFAALPAAIDKVFTQAFLDLLSNFNGPNQLVRGNANGKVPFSQIEGFTEGLPFQFVADIAARDAIPVGQRTKLYFVADASADLNVTAGSAGYAWDSANSEWLMFFEFESSNIDFDTLLSTNDTLILQSVGPAYFTV